MTARDDPWFSDDATNPGKKRPRPRAVPADASPLAEAILGVRAKLLTSNNGSPRKIVANATTIFALDPRWNGVLAHDALSDRVVKLKAPEWHADDAPKVSEPGQWTDADTTRAQAWLSREYGLDLGADTANAAVQAAAERNAFDPLGDYFGALPPWDGVERIDTFLPVVFRADDTPYTRAIGRRWLISAVARALRPGCKVDHVLVLEGLQGKKKSTALERLCPSADLFFDSELSIGDKDAYQVLRGKWIVELGELAAISRHDLAILKAFITRRIDTYRPSFGRRPIDSPRRFLFAASTNEREYLKDPTGNRRWWPVWCPGPIDIGLIEEARDQLWAEALQALEAGAPWWLESDDLTAVARVEQEEREQVHPWEEQVAKYLAGLLERAGGPQDHHAPRCECVRCRGVTTAAVLLGALGIEPGKQGRADEGDAGKILRGLGWEKGKLCRQDGGRVRPYFPPPSQPAPPVVTAL